MRDQRQILDHGLRNHHTVEGIAMMKWQMPYASDMHEPYGEEPHAGFAKRVLQRKRTSVRDGSEFRKLAFACLVGKFP